MTKMTEQKAVNPIQVADRLFGALELMARGGEMSLTEITGALSLNKSTAHRILSSLIYMGYAKQNQETGKYSLTFKIVDLSNQVIQKVDIVSSVHPFLRELMELSGETVHFVERDGADAVYIDKIECFRNSVQMVSRIGSRIPVYRSGVGKALVAGMEDAEVREIWDNSNVVRMTPYTITDFDEFRHELSEVRARGYALDNEENETGVRCIAAAVDVPGSADRYAFSISAPVTRMDNDRIRELAAYVLQIKEEINSQFR